MRAIGILVLGTGLAFSGFCAQQNALADADEGAIRVLVKSYMEARNNKDPEATRALFTGDADQLVSSGEWRRGINGLIAGAMASSKKENGRSVIKVESIRPLDSNIAIVDGRYETMSDSTAAVRKMWTTLLVQKTANGWKIAAIRNMLPSTPNPGK